MRFLKKLFIPKENAQEITELESWTIKWGVYSGWSGNRNYHHKVIINEADAREFKKQLEACAKFINVSMMVEIYKN